METINLKEILDGELIDSPQLTLSEKLDFAMALTDALKARHQEFNGSDAEWDVITDNYISYILENFPIDTIIAVMVRGLRTYKIPFNAETDTFSELFEVIAPWIVGDGTEWKGVYVGDGKYDKDWKPPEDKNLVAGSGGHFTLRDHNK